VQSWFRSHASDKVSTMPSPQRLGRQLVRQAAFGDWLLLVPLSHCSLNGAALSVILSPHRGF
jgi:hypothetical protein